MTSGIELEMQMDLAERYTPMIVAAGMYSRQQTPYNLFALATAIRRDPVVQARVRSGKWDYNPMPQFPAMVGTDYVGLLEAMTEREKDALHDRIMTVHPQVKP